MFNIDSLFLDDEYTVDVKVRYSLNYSIAGILRISNKQITLEVFGETNKNNKYEYKEYFENLECTNYLNSTFILLGVRLVSSHSSRLSHDRGSFYNRFEIKEILYNKNNIMKDIKFYELSFKSEDIIRWIGNTNLQQTIIDNYYNKTLSEIDTKEFIIDLEDSYLIVHYPITTYMNSAEQKAGIHFSPIVNIKMKEETTFEVLKEKYLELLNLFYLLTGYDIKVSQILLYSDNNDTTSYYYNQDLDRRNDRLIFLNLGHNLRFEEDNINRLPLNIFQNYFTLSSYEKRLFSYYKKYKLFDYGEENFLGFFRILENTMFDNEIFSEELAENLNKEETRENLKEHHINNCKNKKLKSPYCIAYIKLLVFYNMLDNELKEELKITKQNIRDIVKLRNDITHFNEYNVSIEKIKEYAVFLEFFSTYTLLSLLEYPKEQFHNNIRFYANYHMVKKVKGTG